jgi:hypothetical protein
VIQRQPPTLGWILIALNGIQLSQPKVLCNVDESEDGKVNPFSKIRIDESLS